MFSYNINQCKNDVYLEKVRENQTICENNTETKESQYKE